MMRGKRKFNSAAVQALYNEFVGSDPSARDEFEQELVNIEVARLIHDMRPGAAIGASHRHGIEPPFGTSCGAAQARIGQEKIGLSGVGEHQEPIRQLALDGLISPSTSSPFAQTKIDRYSVF